MIENRKKFNIDTQGDKLVISYKWFSPVALFLVFFCIAWDGFLVMWFTIDSPVFFKLFAIIHLAVGIGLTYYTICLFVNTTFIEVDKHQISIWFTPLPWIGKKKVNAKEIDQIFVKEKVTQGKNGTSRTYQLKALMKNGNNTTLLGSAVGGEAEDSQFLERKIEDFLGIRDRQVAGEYMGQAKPSRDQIPRRKEVKYNPTNLTIKNLLKGFVLTYNLKSWEVIYEAQYDWANGESDKLYRLSGEDNSHILVYVREEMGLLTPFIEDKLQSNEQTQAFGKLNAQTAPTELDFNDDHYRKLNYSAGKMFVSGSQNFSEMAQWFYVSAATEKSLRIVQFTHGEVAVFMGKQAKEMEFTNILPSEDSRRM